MDKNNKLRRDGTLPQNPTADSFISRGESFAYPTQEKLVLGSFLLGEEIGSGSFATAFLAQQQGTDRQAVVKIMHAHLMKGRNGQAFARRFATEFQAATRVQHPNLATVFLSGYTPEGLPAIAMEYVQGPSLMEVLEQQAPLDESLALSLLAQLVSVLQAVHEAGVVHRDLTPRNILVQQDPISQRFLLKLLDFGVAKLSDMANQTAGPVGTPRYMAPEQIEGGATFASDIYSAGAILWWMMTGQEYLGHIQRTSKVFAYHRKPRPVPDPRHINHTIPDSIARLIRQMLEFAPERRPSAAEVLAFLNPWNLDPTHSRTIAARSRESESMASAGTLSSGVSQSSSARSTHDLGMRPQVRKVLVWDHNPLRTDSLIQRVENCGYQTVQLHSFRQLMGESHEACILLVSDALWERYELALWFEPPLSDPVPQSVLLLRSQRGGTEFTAPDTTFLQVLSPERLDQIGSVLDSLSGVQSSLNGLQTALAKSNSASSTGSGLHSQPGVTAWPQEVLDVFMGNMPEWLLDLEEAIEDEQWSAIPRLIVRMTSLARSLDLSHFVMLVEGLGAAVNEEKTWQAEPFLLEIHQEYNKAFQRLLKMKDKARS